LELSWLGFVVGKKEECFLNFSFLLISNKKNH
jgi:hypothetical protein